MIISLRTHEMHCSFTLDPRFVQCKRYCLKVGVNMHYSRTITSREETKVVKLTLANHSPWLIWLSVHSAVFVFIIAIRTPDNRLWCTDPMLLLLIVSLSGFVVGILMWCFGRMSTSWISVYIRSKTFGTLKVNFFVSRTLKCSYSRKC